MNDVENCPICGLLMTDETIESFGLVRWDPETRTNSLIQMFCAEHRPLPAPEWMSREVGRS